jgi:hypothetical protein
MIRRAAFAVVLSLSAAAFADGGDQPKAPPAPPAPPAAPAAKPAAPAKEKEEDKPTGFKATVKLANGHSLSGVVRVAGSWERHDEKAGWTACGKDDAGACVRLWYVAGGDGYMVVPAKNVQEIENDGALDDADLKKIAGDAAAAEKRAESERETLRKQREARRAAEEKAAAEAAKPKTPEELAKEAADKRAAELLAKFPPKDWGPERRDEINHRALVMKVMPTKEEREFLDNYAEWSKAAAAAAAKEIADKKDAEKAGGDKPAEKKDESKKDDGGKSEPKKDEGKGDGK